MEHSEPSPSFLPQEILVQANLAESHQRLRSFKRALKSFVTMDFTDRFSLRVHVCQQKDVSHQKSRVCWFDSGPKPLKCQDPGDTAIKTFRGCFNKMTAARLFKGWPERRMLSWQMIAAEAKEKGITYTQIREASLQCWHLNFTLFLKTGHVHGRLWSTTRSSSSSLRIPPRQESSQQGWNQLVS